MKILVATKNEGKIKEIKEILKEYEIISLKEINCDIEVEENGKTFEENAKIKAKAIYNKTKIGENKSGNEYSRERNEYILAKMKDIPKERRKAKHITCIAYCDKYGVKVVRGEEEGYIANEPKGEGGFGFDEIFELENGKTYAQIGKEEKNKISSRKRALEKIREVVGVDLQSGK